MAKTITKDSFFHSRLQQFVANSLFPAGAGDWYKNKGYGKKGEVDDEAPFRDFVEKQKTDKKSHYYKEFQGLDLSLKKGLFSRGKYLLPSLFSRYQHGLQRNWSNSTCF